MALHAQRERLDPVQDQERIERRDRGAEIAQGQHAAGDREGEIAEGFGEDHAAVFGPGRREHGIALVAHPFERAAVDDHAAHRIAVPAQIFGRGMDDDVGAVFGGADQIGRSQRIVDDQRNLRVFGDLGDRLDVGDDPAGIGDQFDEHRLGLVGQRRAKRVRIVRVGPFHPPVEVLEGVVELVDRAAVELGRCDEFVAGLHQRMKRHRLRGMAGGDAERRRRALQRGDALLQRGGRGIGDAGVDVAERLQAEQRGRVIDVVEHEGGGLVDRRDPRAGGRVRPRAGVDRKGREAGFVVTHVGVLRKVFPIRKFERRAIGARAPPVSCPRKRASRLGRACRGSGFPLTRE